MTAELKSTSQGQTMILSLSNPALHNALEPQMYAAGVEALSAAESNPDVHSIVIVGAGRHFSVGGNLRRMQANRNQSADAQAQQMQGLHDWIEAIRTCPKPVIAAVEGAAAGGGFSLALACDFIVAARNAKFVMAYSSVALSPDGGGSWHLSRSLPRQIVSELLMLGEPMSAQRLHALGLVNVVCEPDDALSDALALAERLNARAANALASIKELLGDAAHTTLDQHLALERDHFVKNLHHANAGIAIDAFLGKTTPVF
ncbi:MAG: enoyl-CoA hydratase [Betaproteobacteria bacterium]